MVRCGAVSPHMRISYMLVCELSLRSLGSMATAHYTLPLEPQPVLTLPSARDEIKVSPRCKNVPVADSEYG
jgi:hypothetical protein